MKLLTFLIIALLALLSSTATARPGNSRYHSAKCLAKKKKCTTYLERQSGVCKAGRYARNQSRACHERACAWCKLPGKRNSYPCTADNVIAICRAVAAGRRVKPYVPPRRRPSTRPPTTRPPTNRPASTSAPRPAFQPGSGTAPKSGCVYSGSNKVVVDLGNVPMASGWTRTSRAGLRGIVFKKDKGGGIDPARPATTMCYKMKVSEAGDYLATAVSAAPHPTEHNDMWISSSLGFKLLRNGVFKNGAPGEFLKAYQNNGGNRLAGHISNVDHRPHAFIIPDLGPGKVLTYCMSGRSSKYEVFKLIIVKCPSRLCLASRPATNSLLFAAPSRCS